VRTVSACDAVDPVDAAVAETEILLEPEDIVGWRVVGLSNVVRKEMHGMGSKGSWEWADADDGFEEM
jgi:hypothetical protein